MSFLNSYTAAFCERAQTVCALLNSHPPPVTRRPQIVITAQAQAAREADDSKDFAQLVAEAGQRLMAQRNPRPKRPLERPANTANDNNNKSFADLLREKADAIRKQRSIER
jgi:hypothetical protein